MTMMRNLLAASMSALSIVALAASMTAAYAPKVEAKTQILTERAVKQFIASYPDVKAIAAKHAKQKGATLAGAQDHIAALIEVASDKTIVKEIDSAVQTHGFSDAAQWMAIAESVSRAYAHIKTAAVKSKAGRKVEKAISKIEKNPLLSDKQKANLIDALRGGADAILEEPPPENIAAVKPMMGEIEAVMQ